MQELAKLLERRGAGGWEDLLSAGGLPARLRAWPGGADDSDPDRCWELLEPQQTDGGVLKRACGESGPPSLRGCGPVRLHRNVCHLFASGMAAKWLAQSADLAPERLAVWLSRLVGLPEGQLVRSEAARRAVIAWTTDLATRLESIVDDLPDEHRALPELWLRWWLGQESQPSITSTRRIPFASYREDGNHGEVHDLLLRVLKRGKPGLLEHPDIWDRRLAPEVADAIGVAHTLAHADRPFAGPVVWPLSPRGSADLNVRMEGKSHTAAACVGFHVLAHELDYDAGCLVAALVEGAELRAWEDNPSPTAPLQGEGLNRPSGPPLRFGEGLSSHALRPVRGLKAKCDRASELGFDRVVIAAPLIDPVNESELTQSVIDGYKPRMQVLPCGTLAEAIQEATGLAAGCRRYLDWVAGLPDRDLPGYLGGRKLTKLHIEPDVYRDQCRLDRDEGGGREAVERLVLSAESDSEELLLRYGHFGPDRSRVPWEREWPKARRAVIVGFPGEGKTVLARLTARALAERGKRELTEQGRPAALVTLPVFLRLADLAEHGSLEDAVEASLPGQKVLDLPLRFRKHLRANVLGRHTWLILDGLDEVTADKRPGLVRLLEPLREAACQALVTSRPYGYRRGELPFSVVTEYELAPLSPKQRRLFLKAWFTHTKDDEGQARVRSLVDGHASMRETARNALLLTLACAESEIRHLDPKTTRRVHLYYWAVRDLMRGAWKDEPQAEDDLLDQEFETLRELAWDLFRSSPAGVIFENEALSVSLKRQGYNRFQAAELLGKWRKRGLLLAGIAPKRQRAGSFFLHRTFLEFLAADHVAELVRRQEVDGPSGPGGPGGADAVVRLAEPLAKIESYLWQPDGERGHIWVPAAQEFLAFLAGSMKQPDALLRRLMRENDERPDALGVMLRLAGRCLAETDEAAIRQDLREQVVGGCFRVWDALGRTARAARGLGSRCGVARLAQALRDDTDSDVRRSAAEALGALGDVQAVGPLLLALRDDTDSDVRMRAAGALGALGDVQAVGPLLLALRDDPHSSVRMRAAEALGALGDAQAVGPLLLALRDDTDSYVRWRAAEALGALGDVQAVGPLLLALRDDPHIYVRMRAAEALGALGDVQAVGPLLLALRDDTNGYVRMRAAEALGALGDVQAVGPLLLALRDDTESFARQSAAGALGALGDVQAVGPLLLALRDDTHRDVRMRAAGALGALGDAQAVGPLLLVLRDDTESFARQSAAEALRALGDVQAVGPLLLALRDDTHRDVRMRAAGALGALGDVQAVGPLLLALRDDPHSYVRRSAAEVLERFLDTPRRIPPGMDSSP